MESVASAFDMARMLHAVAAPVRSSALATYRSRSILVSMGGVHGRLTATEVLGEGGLLSRVLEGHRPRTAQLDMAALVERCLDGDGVGLVEAGTGTGKTFAYLVPALLSGRRVVVSTGTRALQDQIALRDVPTLERAFGETLPVAVLKGLGNYLCVRRFEELLGSPESVTRRELVRHLPLVQEFRLRSMTGERGELTAIPEDAPIWPLVVATSETRVGKRCAHFDECFVARARTAAEQARVVVVNHHLFFADLALRRRNPLAAVIPPYDAVVFDEAHQLEDVLTQFSGIQLGGPRIDALVRDADRTLGRGDPQREPLLRTVMYRAGDLFDALPRGGRGEGKQALTRAMRAPTIDDRLASLEVALEALSAHCQSIEESEALLVLVRRIDELRDELVRILEVSEPGELVVYTESRGRNPWLCASPIDVARTFAREVLEVTPAVVLTSATLSTAGSFSFVKARLGIGDEVEEVLLESPFDVRAQAALYLPPMPDPREPRFVEAAAEEVRALTMASEGGAFVLTTSFRVMHALHAALELPLRDAGLEVLLQTSAPKSELLERFRRSERAVLFATQSFWEGVDVPGHALRLVIIDRLPFEVPTDPLVHARCERLELAGQSAFMEYLVPSAALALKQGFGRLLRREDDRGVVAILDPRLTTKAYGKTLLRSLPDVPRTNVRNEATWLLGDIRRTFLDARPAPEGAASSDELDARAKDGEP